MKIKGLRFRGFWFLGFTVSWFIGFKVSWCQSFKDLPNVISCFLIDLDLASKIILVLGPGDTSENPEIIEMRSFGFSRKQIQKL